MTEATGYAALEARGVLRPFDFERRDPGPEDIVIETLYCGVCHSDLHMVNNDWQGGVYPMVPGHEIIGRVVHTGAQVHKFKLGDLAGIGCYVDSCRQCSACDSEEEHFCEQGMTATYNGYERGTKRLTYGGYSNNYVTDQHFAVRISPKLDPARAAPLLCAGITAYSALRHWKVAQGQKVGVVGLGGVGHVAVKIVHALGARVVLLTTSQSKIADAKRLSADEVVVSTDREQLKKHMLSLDFILDTVSAAHDFEPYLGLLKRNGTLCVVGMPEAPTPFHPRSVVYGHKSLAGSMIGSIRETQEMLDFCAEHGIGADIELIGIQQINEAFERLRRNDVKYRFVINLTRPAS